ncbi:MAG TPA: lipoate--protein ligase family protein [Acidimicrobiia bacterium]|nr:lipoate--protein ligase family protein [Acidimicrobiia bacterium]
MLRLIIQSFSPPLLDTAVSSALLRQVDEGAPATLRLFVPQRIVAFGRQDRVLPGYHDALEAVRGEGFHAVERLAGGKAATFHEGTLAFAWSTPETHPRETIHERFEALASIMVEAFESLGIDARVGEVPGEYCPGRYSVNAAGRRKLMGVGQRLLRRSAHVGGVVVVEDADLVNRPLLPAYEALGYQWDPSATGALADEAPVDVATAIDAILAAFRSAGHELVPGKVNEETLDLARAMTSEHDPAIA